MLVSVSELILVGTAADSDCGWSKDEVRAVVGVIALSYFSDRRGIQEPLLVIPSCGSSQDQNKWGKKTKGGHTHTHTRLTALFLGLPGWAGARKVKPIWILLKQETVSGSSISWAICKSAPRSKQITTPAPHHSVFYRPDALPAAQPTVSEHWRQNLCFCEGKGGQLMQNQVESASAVSIQSGCWNGVGCNHGNAKYSIYLK